MTTTTAHQAHPVFTGAVSHGSYAKYVGRVGALAVALGIGVAVATSPGFWVAHADDVSSSSSENPPSDAASDSSDTTSGIADTLDSPTTSPSDGSDGSGGANDPSEQGSDVADMDVDSSGGEDTSTNDQGQSTDEEPADTSEPEAPDSVDNQAPIETTDPEVPDPSDGIENSEDAVAQNNSGGNDQVSSSPAAGVDDAVGIPDTSGNGDVTYARVFTTDDVQDFTDGQRQLPMIATAQDVSVNRVMAPLDTADSPAQSLMAIPQTIISVCIHVHRHVPVAIRHVRPWLADRTAVVLGPAGLGAQRISAHLLQPHAGCRRRCGEHV